MQPIMVSSYNRARASSVLVTCDTACGASSKAAQQNGAWVKFSLSRGEKAEKMPILISAVNHRGGRSTLSNFVVLGEEGKGKYSISMFTLCLVRTRMGLCSYLCYACLCRAMSMKYKVDSRYGPLYCSTRKCEQWGWWLWRWYQFKVHQWFALHQVSCTTPYWSEKI